MINNQGAAMHYHWPMREFALESLDLRKLIITSMVAAVRLPVDDVTIDSDILALASKAIDAYIDKMIINQGEGLWKLPPSTKPTVSSASLKT